MNDIELNIDILINSLNKSDDALLIELLKLKKKEFVINEINERNHFTEVDFNKTKYHSANKINTFIINNNIIPEQPIENKINKILSKYDCDNCKYSITKKSSYRIGYNMPEYEYTTFNEKSHVCKSCVKRTTMLSDYLDETMKKQDIIDKIKTITLNNNEYLLKCLTIIPKLRKKLKN